MTNDVFNKLLPILTQESNNLVNVEKLRISINNEPIMYIKIDNNNGNKTIYFISGIIGGKHTITYKLNQKGEIKMTEKEQIVNVLEAYYIDKKKIQFRDKNSNDEWMDMTKEPKWNWDEFDYRVKPTKKKKPKPKYRPFFNTQEILDAMQKNGCSVIDKRKGDVYKIYITNFIGKDWGHVVLEKFFIHNNDTVYEYTQVSVSELFNYFYFINNIPCGVKIA